jgi:hypothetical protein
MRERLQLFFLMCIMGGALAVAGSILGNAFGRTGLFTGGVVGGLLGVLAAAKIAEQRGWIERSQMQYVAMGGIVGFFCAASIAVYTLSTPIGPILSTLLIGGGALFAAIGSVPRTNHDSNRHTAS